MRWVVVLALVTGCHRFFGIDTLPLPDASAPTDGDPLPGRWLAVSAGAAGACGIDRTDHSLWCWGSNSEGAIGTGTSDPEVGAPVRVGGAAWTAIAAGNSFACGIQIDGSLWCWGHDAEGELGDGGLEAQHTPVMVSGPTWIAISTSNFHACGIRDDGSLWCWGYNVFGQLGDGTAISRVVPVEIGASAKPWSAVRAGSTSTCAIAAVDHTAWCWGSNASGQLGSPTAPSGALPSQIPTETWDELAVAADAACGITTDHRLRCWGSNSYGIDGDGSQVGQSTPVPVLMDGVDRTDWIDVAAAGDHACARRADLSLWCWGEDLRGALVQPLALGYALTPVAIGGGGWQAISLGSLTTCAIDSDRALFCGGNDSHAELGDGGSSYRVPTAINQTLQRLALGGNVTCTADASGVMSCAGDNGYGQIGDGTTVPRSVFATVGTTLGTTLAPGHTHTCSSNGQSTFCWGSNGAGELGLGTVSAPIASPSVISGFGFESLASSAHTCGVGSGLMYCWGPNQYGQLGDASQIDRSSPTAVTGTWVSVAVGQYHSCAIAGDTKVYCWGHGSEGQLGSVPVVMADTIVTTPTPVGTSATSLAVGDYYTCVVTLGGSAQCWGYNNLGQLGLGDHYQRALPAVLPNTWLQLAAGSAHTCGIDTTHRLWCWGDNSRGQLGDGTLISRAVPVPIGTATWTAIRAGTQHTCGLQSDGSLWCWGDNDYGQLGDGSAWRTHFVQVP